MIFDDLLVRFLRVDELDFSAALRELIEMNRIVLSARRTDGDTHD
jgi:hypothetical protein